MLPSKVHITISSMLKACWRGRQRRWSINMVSYIDSGSSAGRGSSTFQSSSERKNPVLSLWPKLFRSIITLMGCFHLKKKGISEAVKILARRLYDLVPTAGEERDFSILGATLFIYFTQNPVSLSRIRKKSTTKPTASIVHNTHILLSNTNLSSAMVSQNKAFCNNAGLQRSCSQAVNSVRELIWLKKILQQMPCYFLKLGKFANSVQKDPQHSRGNASSAGFGFLRSIKKLHTEWAWMSLSTQAPRQSLPPDCPVSLVP